MYVISCHKKCVFDVRFTPDAYFTFNLDSLGQLLDDRILILLRCRLKWYLFLIF